MSSIEKDYFTVNSKESLQKAIKLLYSSDTLAFDTETTGLNVRKDRVVGASFSPSIGVSFYIPTLLYDKDTDSFKDIYIDSKKSNDILKTILNYIKQENKKLITHNGSFDTAVVYHQFGIDLVDLLWCETTLAVHTVQEEGAFGFGNPFALKSIAQMYKTQLSLDDDLEANQEQIDLKESILENGGAITKTKFELYKADSELLSKYACADTDLTYRVATLFLEQIKKEDLWDFFFIQEVMPVYKEVTIPMERRGVLLDIDYIKKTDEEISQTIEEYKRKVISQLMSFRKVKEFVFEKMREKFPPKSKGSFAKKLVEIKNLPLEKKEDGSYKLVKKSIQKLEDSLYKSFLLQEEKDYSDIENDFNVVSLQLWKEFNSGNIINIQSKKHLSDICFEYLNLEPLSLTAKGAAQVDDTFIESISKDHQWADDLRVFNRLVKIKSTYVERLMQESDGGVFYPYFKQHGTVTGRYGSNLQQLPKPKEKGSDHEVVIEFNNRIRAFFIARKDYKFIDSDYESLEPHIFASISEDENLQEIFNKGHDFYSTVAIRTEKLQGVSADKKADNYLNKIDSAKRQKAKAYALGIAYGMSGYALAKSLDINSKEGDELRQAYLEGFPGVANWIEKSRKEFQRTGTVRNIVGRTRHLYKGKEVYDKYRDSLLNSKYRESLSFKVGSDTVMNMYRDLKNAYNACLNFQIQSLAASIVNRAALMINRELKNKGIDGQVIAQIHDQLIIEIHEKNAEEFMPIIKHIMENTTKLPGVTLKAPPSLAVNFLEGH